MIALSIWAFVAVWGIWRNRAAWAAYAEDLVFYREADLDARVLVQTVNHVRRFKGRFYISVNNLILAIGLSVGHLFGLRTPWWFGLIYFPASLIGNEVVVNFLTELDLHARREIIRKSLGEKP